MTVDTLLNNRYAISDVNVAPLGKGGMAIIYAGTDTETDEPIAAKTLLPAYQGDTHRRQRFRREAAVLKAVQGPHIVELLDVVDGRHGTWIVMEQLHGETLRRKLDREGAFSPSAVDAWLVQVSAALEHMHRLGYVHLDVTLQNLFLTSNGNVELIDFGIAQRAYVEPQREGNKLLGTAAYISPEHGSGRTVTPVSDVYSLGCVMFELLTGKKVFSEHGHLANDATITMRQNTAPELPTSVVPELDLPPWVDSVIGRALIPTPGDRYPSVTAFTEEFHARANPPLFRLSWPKRQRLDRVDVHAINEEPGLTFAQPQSEYRFPEHEQRQPSAPRRWLQKELRNARRALLVFALLLTMVLGAPLIGGSMVMDWLLGAVPGSTTQVIDGNWYLRAEAGSESEVRTLMPQGQEVRVSGTPSSVNNDLWWPVSTELDGNRISGWAHDDGLQRTWLMDRAAQIHLFKTELRNKWDFATAWLPG